MRTVLVLSAHPDDEVLGCGGTIARLASAGCRVHIAHLADGVKSRVGTAPQSDGAALEHRREAARSAAAILGAASVEFTDFPDNRMDTVALLDIVQVIESLVDRHQPDTIFTHHAGDVNVDHRRVHDAMVAACRPQPGHPVRTILSFEIPSSTEWQLAGHGAAFVPSWFSDITEQVETKARALHAYEDEMRAWPHSRSHEAIDHLQRWRGASVGVKAAEAFVLGRHVERA